MEERKITANNIRAERNRKNLTQDEVAKLLGVSRETYCGIEKGNKMDYVLAYKLALILNCKIDDFYLGLDTTKCGEE